MIRSTEAIFENGVLKPVEAMNFREGPRVRIIVQEVEESTTIDREAARRRFLAGVRRSRFKSTGPYPTRDELHERR